MRFALDEDQAALRNGVRSLLRGECPPAAVRAAWSGTAEAEPERVTRLWEALAEMGIPGAAVPEESGGLGLDACTIVALLEETGRVAVPLPIMETTFVGGPLLAADPAAAPRLERLVAGELIVTATFAGSDVVPFARVSQLALLSDDAQHGAVIRALELDAATEPVAGIDGARALGRLIDPQAGAALAVSTHESAAAWWRGVLGCSAQLVGLARGLLELTAGYVTERRQFGVPVGSFQAIKHHLADALIAVEFAAPAVLRAAWSLDQGAPTAARDAAMAKALASEAADHVARVALQCHGAIAYTTEYDLHLAAKRVWATTRTWGRPAAHRRFIAGELGLVTG